MMHSKVVPTLRIEKPLTKKKRRGEEKKETRRGSEKGGKAGAKIIW